MEIYEKKIGLNCPTYFIAEIGSNFDGDLGRATDLIKIAADSGADAVKFQHYTAQSLVSDVGFRALGSETKTHQTKWEASVSEVYEAASLNQAWTASLSEAAHNEGIAFITSPYSTELVDYVEPFVDAYKIGSGDITYNAVIEKICQKNKPILIAAGASTLEEIALAMELLAPRMLDVCLMQCNTNYEGTIANAKYQNLNVIKSFQGLYSKCLPGLSCHMPGSVSVIGAVALGARVIEKHFTDDRARPGPDHAFAMMPNEWERMVQETRLLESMLGDGYKRVEKNEEATVIVQQRSLRANRDIAAGEVVEERMVDCLRPCPKGSLKPFHLKELVGKTLTSPIKRGESFTLNLFRED
jgi:sialic acid synthase SpsE